MIEVLLKSAMEKNNFRGSEKEKRVIGFAP